MTFQAMMSGAECAASSTALGQFMRHAQDDRSLHHDRLGGSRHGAPASSTFRSIPLSSIATTPREVGQTPFMAAARPGIAGGEFDLGHIMSSMNVTGTGSSGSASDLEATFRALHPTQSVGPASGLHVPVPSGWKEEFHRAQAAVLSPSHVAVQHRPAPMSGPHSGMGRTTMAMGRTPCMATRPMMFSVLRSGGMGPGLVQAQQARLDQDHRFHELSDENWEAQFAKLDEQVASEAQANVEKKAEGKQKPQTVSPHGPFMEETEKCMYNEAGRVDAIAITKALEEHTQASRPTIPEQADEDFGRAKARSHVDAQDLPDWLHSDMPQEAFNIIDSRQDSKAKYRMQPSNPFLTHPDPMAEGIRLLADGGALSDVTLLFEAATQRTAPSATSQADETGRVRERSEAWRRLGEAHAMNEMDLSAIRALEKSIEIDPSNREAYIPLAASYANEGYERSAWRTLKGFCKLAHPHLKQPVDSPNPVESFEEVTGLFLRAAREGAAEGVVDADVQVGLGVLFFSTGQFAQANDCFKSALSVRPNDSMLWNRLGAALANSGNSEEAISAYHRALELRPTFTRAIYNLSVSCLNLGANHEAAEHLLAAIALQRDTVIPQAPREEGQSSISIPLDSSESQNLWSTLRRIFIGMDRTDLATKAHVGTPLDEFKMVGFDF